MPITSISHSQTKKEIKRQTPLENPFFKRIVYGILETYCQLRARRGLALPKDIPLRTRRALSPETLYSNNALLVLKETALNSDSALLALTNDTALFMSWYKLCFYFSFVCIYTMHM